MKMFVVELFLLITSMRLALSTYLALHCVRPYKGAVVYILMGSRCVVGDEGVVRVDIHVAGDCPKRKYVLEV